MTRNKGTVVSVLRTLFPHFFSFSFFFRSDPPPAVSFDRCMSDMTTTVAVLRDAMDKI